MSTTEIEGVIDYFNQYGDALDRYIEVVDKVGQIWSGGAQ